MPFASAFLAGAILSLVLPAGLLIAIAAWYWRGVRSGGERADEDVATAAVEAPETTRVTTIESPPTSTGT